MPCEGCHVSFTMFRRKRSCSDCKCFYCINCLSKSKRTPQQIELCERCAIFAKRPLLRADLLTLKPKDLIFYLQSKHVSTTGCVEKEELIVLILDHVQQTHATCPDRDPNINGSRTDAEQGNSFDSFKQTCQNFFSNITENITDSFSSLDEKSKFKSYHDINRGTQTSETYISDQPRISRREIPTYASFQIIRQAQSPSLSDQVTSVYNTRRNSDCSSQRDGSTNRQQANTIQSEVTNNGFHRQMESFTPVTSYLPANEELGNFDTIDQASLSNQVGRHEEVAGCECSDEELITIFNEHKSICKLPKHMHGETTTRGCGIMETSDFKENICEGDGSSQSSFEELGAIGGISDDSKTTTDTNSSNIDQWQVLDTQQGERVTEEGYAVPQDLNKIIRRRSDGYLNQCQPQSDDECPTCINLPPKTGGADLLQEKEESGELEEWRINCKRCGKSKFNIKKRVEKMRRHLENSQMSETDIKRELKEFLAYLEHRTKSIDYSDSETVSSTVGGTTCTQSDVTPSDYFDENDGIHVYAAPSRFNGKDSRFINLENFDSLQELETLSVKQLKEVLMLHRVDYKGCCEKQELLDRVERLWKNLRSYPASEKLHTEELCKICMDAPIECVILECGHMATCTNCGKVLSECPICRQYIVRVVRFFRA